MYSSHSLRFESFNRSKSFKTVPQIFGLTVVYGVFHGLVFLPVLLSSLGPSGSGSEGGDSVTEETETSSENTNNNRDKAEGISTISGRLSPSKSVEDGRINPVFTDI